MDIKKLLSGILESGLECVVGGPQEVHEVSSLKNYKKGTLTFCTLKHIEHLNKTNGALIIVPDAMYKSNLPHGNTYIFSPNPRITFLRAMKLLYPHFIEPKITKGNNCRIHKSAILGAEGFGYERNERGELEPFICIGGITIGSDVNVGACTTIDRGTIDDTYVGDGTKIDNLVYIAHNVLVGKHCDIRANAMLAGSCKIGDYTTIASGAQIRDGTSIGKNAFIGLGSVVTKDIPDEEMWVGNPARKFRDNAPIFK